LSFQLVSEIAVCGRPDPQSAAVIVAHVIPRGVQRFYTGAMHFSQYVTLVRGMPHLGLYPRLACGSRRTDLKFIEERALRGR
jgi:hypothetical protein